MKFFSRTTIIILVLFFCVGCDQVTKSIAKHRLPNLKPISLLHDTIRLQCIENPGGFLSLGSNIPEEIRYWVFTILMGVFLLVLLVYQFRARHFSIYQTVALSCVLGGGFGNWVDRITNYGRVIDFINLGIGPLRTGIFNVADIAITFGIVLFIIVSVKTSNKRATTLQKSDDV